MLSRLVPALVALVGLTNCFQYQDPDPYNHLLSNLYRLAELEPVEDVYEPIKGLDNRDAGWPDVAYTDILNEAQLRDQEYEPQNPLYGYQYVSGMSCGVKTVYTVIIVGHVCPVASDSSCGYHCWSCMSCGVKTLFMVIIICHFALSCHNS